MARYKVSNKNIYGFKDNIFQTLLFAVPVSIVLGLLVTFVAGPLLYRFYVKDVTPEAGTAGTAATEDVPVAQSVADMERLDTFTLITEGAVLKYDTIHVDGTDYHRIRLPSGEKIVAHVNMQAIQKTGEAGVYRLPVGEWKEWEPPEQVMILEGILAETDYYADMYGDYVPVASSAGYSDALGHWAVSWIVLALMLLHRVTGVRTGRFAPCILVRRDPLLPRNDLECWCASTFAIWAHFFSSTEGWPLVSGAHRSREALIRFRRALRDQWDITNREDGLETVHELIDRHAGQFREEGVGWDLCRATQLLGMMYLVKMIDREELDQEFSRAGQVIQRTFSSWDEMAESYLKGYGIWRTGVDADSAPQNIAARRNIYERLKENAYGPYTIPWRTDLSLIPGVGGGREKKAVNKILSGYRPNL